MNLEDLRDKAVITVTDTAALLGVDERTVRRACEDGQLPSITVGRRILVPAPKLLAMLGADEMPTQPQRQAGLCERRIDERRFDTIEMDEDGMQEPAEVETRDDLTELLGATLTRGKIMRLRFGNIDSVADLVQRSEADLLDLHQFGPGSVAKVIQALADRGLSLSEDGIKHGR